MPRRLRIQYPGAIYHIMARGNGRQDFVPDVRDRERLLSDLARTVQRCSWRVDAFVILSNHLDIVLKTPLPNLARGMRRFLSAYANAWARRHGLCGHVFQGRSRTELVEDETDLWTVSRSVHRNPVGTCLAEHPSAWPWSSNHGHVDDEVIEWLDYTDGRDQNHCPRPMPYRYLNWPHHRDRDRGKNKSADKS